MTNSKELEDFKFKNADREPVVDVFNLAKTFKNKTAPALKGINFTLEKGGMMALVGPDGAGKTTLLRVLCGLLVPDNSGKLIVGGFSPVDNLNDVKKIIGYMPQKFGLYEDLTVIENLNLYVSLNNGDRAEIETLLKFAGLEEFKNRLAGRLSGGMKQKLGLCCILISKPALLLLDEPSVGVDPLSRRELLKIVQNLVIERDLTIIWATSYLDEAQNFERVLVLSEGEKIYDGSPKMPEILLGGGFEDFVIRKIQENAGKTESQSVKKPVIVDSNNVKTPENTIMIEASHLSKVYGNFTAADDINFKIPKGEIFGLLGPNGAGKSTTFKMLCGLIKPSAGYSSIMGVRMDENPTLARSYLGYMAQKFSLFGNLSVKQNLAFFARVYGLSGFKAKRRVNEMLDFFDLKKYQNIDASFLPLGFKQRLGLACSIIHEPPVLFLDEPTSGTDPISRREFWDEINALSKNGTTVLVTTHFMDEAQYCHRIALIFKGKTLITSTPDELKNLVKTESRPEPTMEDAFIELILKNDDGKK